jgi:hypothetical protein
MIEFCIFIAGDTLGARKPDSLKEVEDLHTVDGPKTSR